MVNKRLFESESNNWAKLAMSNALTYPEIANIQADIASSIQKKTRANKSLELKLLYCKKCKKFSPLLLTSKVRIRNKILLISCFRCGKIYRHPLRLKQQTLK